MTGTSRALRLATALLVAVGATGCPSPEPEAKYDEFLENTEEERDEAHNQRMDVGSQLADVSGTFLFAISTIVDATKPLQFIAEVTFVAEGSGGMISMTLQPLALTQGSTTEPRTPVGDPIEVPAVAVDESGRFTIPSLGTLMVTGDANPITGSDISADVSLEGNILSEDLFCGLAGGEVFQPLMLNLMGSTFAAERIESTDPASLPQDVLFLCPEGGAGEGGGSDEGGSGG